MPRLKDTYKAEIIPAMMQKFSYKNIMQVPKLEKVVINMGMGDIKDNPKGLDSALEELSIISGQKPVVTVARHSVANFKVREGMKIGAKVTLRGDRMSGDSPPNLLTAGATSPWDSKNSWCSPKLIMTRSRRCAAWISSSSPLRTPTKRPANFFRSWACLSRNKEEQAKWLRKA